MINSAFFGHRPSSYKVNPIVRAFIVSEMFFWSGWNLINPIFAIFVTQNIAGGSIEAAGTAMTIYLISRIMVELMIAKSFNKIKDKTRYIISMIGIIGIGLIYLSYCFTTSLIGIFMIQVFLGIGFGIVSPVKMSLFSEHLDKGKESTEWGLYDAVTFTGMALTATLGAFIAQRYGFRVLFFVTAIMVWLGALPFTIFILNYKWNSTKNKV